MKRATSSFVAITASLLLAASSMTLGCASQTASDRNQASSDGLRDCLAACAADPDIVGEAMCGTDGVTYSVCTWHCADVPAGVGVVPGACSADGAAPADGPPKAADGVRICDWTKVAGAWIAIACGASLQTPPREALPTPIRPREDGGDASPANLPAEVDHRVRFGLVKSQGTAPACTAFGTTAALEGAIRSTVGEVTVLSEMHLWSRYAVGSMEQALGAAMSGGTATNDTATAAGLPYDASLALAWTNGDAEPNEDLQSKLDDAARFEVVGVDVLGNGTPGEALVGRIQRAIADGHDVVVALGESDEWRLPDENGIISDHEFGERGAHAVLLVGYKSFEGRPYFLLRNSWGRGWGVNGYAYLSFASAAENLFWASIVHVARKDFAEPIACAGGRSPDLDNVCRVVCPNGALAGDDDLCEHPAPVCTETQVRDASGVCVAACTAGNATGEGYSVTCTAETCSWTVDAGTPGCVSDNGTPCKKVCPAPLCELSYVNDEFGRPHLVCSGSDR